MNSTNTEMVAVVDSSEVPQNPIRMKRPEVYYDVHRKDYYIKNNRGDWMPLTESSLRRQLRALGYSQKVRDGEKLSELETCLNQIQLCFGVDYVGPLAGYEKGLIDCAGRRILVTRSPNLVEPVQGQFPILNHMLQGLFESEELPYVKGWLKVAYESLRNRRLRPGQVLVLAGERDCGKSLFQNLITEMLGGRVAKPYRYMTGGTDFNSDLFGSEHLMIEDEVASTDLRARRNFGARIKDFTVNEVQSCHAKGREALSLKPFWRVSISLNDEPENLMILPPLDDSLVDKLMLLRVTRASLPMPTYTLEERKRFWDTLVAEIPMFVWHLSEWEIPEDLKCPRFGIKRFHHPDILATLNEISPENKLLVLIDSYLFKDNTVALAYGVSCGSPALTQPYVSTAEDLELKLKNSLELGYEAKQLLSWTNATGTYLARLAKKFPNRVKNARTSEARLWQVNPPAGPAESSGTK